MACFRIHAFQDAFHGPRFLLVPRFSFAFSVGQLFLVSQVAPEGFEQFALFGRSQFLE
jgi:hypothetical protein